MTRPGRDPLFWAALAAAPVACLALAALPGLRWQPALPDAPWVFALSVAVYPPLEEWLFRGELQPLLGCRWSARWGPMTLANLVTSIVFAALHLWFHPPLWAAAVFLPSLVFGYFRERSGGLASPIALHAGYNAAHVLLLGSA